MSAQQKTDQDRQFLDTCVELKLLSQTDAELLWQAVSDHGGSISQTALRRRLLTPADVDIVESIQHPFAVVPGYQILGLVGRGGMGVVYRARQTDLDRTVALKTILISNVNNTIAAARFEREAKALARLHHPNIVQALNFGKHEGRYHLAMEFVQGRTCEQAVQDQGIIPAANVWHIVRQVASGLLHALRHDLLHRDIKPANLILVPPPEGSTLPSGTEMVKIADFGLAVFADRSREQMKLTTGEKIIGSPTYMSPEQFGSDPVDFRSDIYSLGATAWHLLFGKPPFRNNNLVALLVQKSEPFSVDPATLPVSLPSSQLQLLTRLLDPDPNRRPQTYEELIHAIDQLRGTQLHATAMAPELTTEQRVAISGQPTLPADSFPRSTTVRQGGSESASRDPTGESVPQPMDGRSSGSSWGRRKWLIPLATLGVVALLAGFLLPRSPQRGPRTYTSVLENTPLFDGVTLSGWDVGGSMVGAWNTVEAPDASTAIACTTRQGALTRQFPVIQHPRISLFVWLQADGGMVDIDFAIDPADPSDRRGCLRLTGSTNLLGEKTTDFGDIRTIVRSPALDLPYDRYHVVHLERQPTDWYVFLDQQIVGTLPISRIGEGNAVRLVVHGSGNNKIDPPLAFFSDVQVDALRVKEPGI